MALGFLSVATATAVAAPTIPSEELVSDQQDLLDPEYSQTRNMITWVDDSGKLWIADVDPKTGIFVPADGKGTLVDPDAMSTKDFRVLGNGPEWISTVYGDQIVYTKFFVGKPHVRATAQIALAQQVQGGAWEYGFLFPPGTPRAVPYSSHDPRDPEPRISYVDPSGNHYWRNLYDPASERRVENYPPNQYFLSMRFVEGERAGTYPRVVDGVSQVFYYDLDTGIDTQITFDSGDKDLASRAWVWHAPEFGGDKVMMTIADNIELRIYREHPGQQAWDLLRAIRTPNDGALNSPEYFVYGNASYVFFVGSVPPATYLSAVFLTNIDPADPQLVQLTPNSPDKARTDPEVFFTAEGPYIYYNVGAIEPDRSRYCIPCNEGIFRTYTGLAPRE